MIWFAGSYSCVDSSSWSVVPSESYKCAEMSANASQAPCNTNTIQTMTHYNIISSLNTDGGINDK